MIDRYLYCITVGYCWNNDSELENTAVFHTVGVDMDHKTAEMLATKHIKGLDSALEEDKGSTLDIDYVTFEEVTSVDGFIVEETEEEGA